MFPIRDTQPSHTYPIVNMALIGANVFVYLLEMIQGPAVDRFIFLYGLVPARYSVPYLAERFSFGDQIFSLFSFMFLHGGFWHLLGNMWSLYIFGDNVEDRLGPFRYLLFYLCCGWVSGLSHLLVNWHSATPTIGASGAVAGVMGGYLLLYPNARILTLIPIFIIPYFLHIPAYIFIGAWFILQFIHAAGAPSQGAGVAWWAHIGGFLFGLVSLKLLLRVPSLGPTGWLQNKAARQKTPRLQVIRTDAVGNDPHLYGRIEVTPAEALRGTIKLVNIPWGFQKRLFRVTIPPGVREGTVIRLKGMGRRDAAGVPGDLFLKVSVR
ncbi:MAG: rhomboid family intramembrane serine protease [Deltaproteobacteria bacterium]|nr:rhomboid family intramembrane serine protease [Deltaproteobacteria bacterium]MBW1924624.1 rhomboid family intramembrane serine protease [Deltaproteobacteria bacterium]MBW1949118.1 rhomboid family intramembrane serine protease [Deltaproteobacteria bacterium]MBW2007407.1 rhomboid family intramembrane serine protease [Deltaproteobacteria bacterium]MBW2101278.1 rhomboid family intramembrane serine protease [Deltaproteobacteria bacterium]